jgi:hypothetical protein
MPFSKNLAAKNRITHMIFTGAAAMVIVFAISLFLPKEWLVSGKIVVFPSGQPTSASVNLLPETFNTAQIIKSESFQKANFGDWILKFEDAKAVEKSSIIQVDFRSSENDIEAIEDLIVKIPDQIDEYARDLYSGSPFKYKLMSDPEISASPVRPNLFLNAIFGFLAGAALYLIYWLGFESREPEIAEMEIKKDKSAIISPEIKTAEPVGKKKIIEKKIITPQSQNSAAPDNLPFIEEPSDEEVKERLNRLMRGEL